MLWPVILSFIMPGLWQVMQNRYLIGGLLLFVSIPVGIFELCAFFTGAWFIYIFTLPLDMLLIVVAIVEALNHKPVQQEIEK